MWQFDRESQHACFDNRTIGFGGELDSYAHGRNTVTPEQVSNYNYPHASYDESSLWLSINSFSL